MAKIYIEQSPSRNQAYSFSLCKWEMTCTSCTLNHQNKRLETTQGSSPRELVKYAMEQNVILCRDKKEWGRSL